jgi:enamine deaminase RidA (YjgF/YER057c/UK114 family)
MTIQRFDAGRRMSEAVLHNHVVYLAGQVADEGVGDSVREQTRSILAGIDALLVKAGTNKSKLLSATIWLADMSGFDEMNSVWDAWVSPGNAPARATVEARLSAPKYLVEIAVIAAV